LRKRTAKKSPLRFQKSTKFIFPLLAGAKTSENPLQIELVKAEIATFWK